MQVMTFDDNDLAPREVQVKIRGEDYVLREADAFAAIRFRNAAVAGMRMKDGKVVGVEGIANLESLLLSMCLFKVEQKNGERVLAKVTEGFVLKLPSRISKQLFEQAKKISELDEGAKDPDPELIGLCRRDLADQFHPDKGGSTDIMKGVNAALDWLKEHRRQSSEEAAKNVQESTESTSP